MTNKRKIELLEQTIKKFSSVVRKFDKDKNAHKVLYPCYGICDYISYNLMTDNEFKNMNKHRLDMTDWFEKYFKIVMPPNEETYRWKRNKQGYQARIRACKNAIKRLEKK